MEPETQYTMFSIKRKTGSLNPVPEKEASKRDKQAFKDHPTVVKTIVNLIKGRT